MRALSQEELEQMLQNDFLMASSCDAEQVVQVAEELMAEGMSHLARAKACHDVLEELYHPHVDFSYGEEQTEKILEEVRSLPDQKR